MFRGRIDISYDFNDAIFSSKNMVLLGVTTTMVSPLRYLSAAADATLESISCYGMSAPG
jgi:hypothetical protein